MRQYKEFYQAVGLSKIVVIFGTGEIAQLTHYALTRVGIRVSFFCDPIESRQDSALRGTPVISPTEFRRLDPQRTSVFDCGDYRRYARRSVTPHLAPFSRLYVSAQLLSDTNLEDADVAILPAERRRRLRLYVSESRELIQPPDGLFLKTLDVVVTEACTMRCVDCANLMQYYAHPRHADLDELETALGRLLAAVDEIEEFRVLGGEPFAHPRVGRVIDTLTALPHRPRVVVYTNATIVPRDRNLASLAHPNVMVDITDYGPLSRRHAEMTEVLTAHGVSWVSKTPTWTDSGRIGLIERDPKQVRRVFHDCCVSDVVTLLNGRLYLCPFSANAMNLSAVPDAPDDVIDLRVDRTPETLRHLIQTLYRRTEPLTACSYCRGRDASTPEVVPAIQVRQPLPLLRRGV
jgi:Radical SAM superfamily